MNIEGLVKRFRTEFLDDDTATQETHYLWKTPHIIAALAKAERDLCRRLFLLSDSTTPEICQITIAAGTDGVFPRSYPMDERIVRIERLKFPGVTTPIRQTTSAWLDQSDPGWDEMEGTPTRYVIDTDCYTITFNRQPISGGIAQMMVKRLPLTPINEKAQNDVPEIRQLDDELIHGGLKYLYLQPNTEGYDSTLSDRWGKEFEADIKRITQDRAAMNPQCTVCRPERF